MSHAPFVFQNGGLLFSEAGVYYAWLLSLLNPKKAGGNYEYTN